MSEIKFSCPGCQQHIECDAGYGGMQINCPSCNAAMIVPGEAPAPVPVPPPAPTYQRQQHAPPPAGGGCPQCGAPMSRGAVLCTKCGFNSATGQRLSPQATAARRGFAVGGSDKWYQNPYVYVGVIALIFMGLFAMAMSSNPLMKLPLAGALLLYILVMYIWVAVVAFKEGVGHGIGCLVCGLYSLYFVYKQDTSTLLKSLYTLLLVLFLIFRIVIVPMAK